MILSYGRYGSEKRKEKEMKVNQRERPSLTFLCLFPSHSLTFIGVQLLPREAKVRGRVGKERESESGDGLVAPFHLLLCHHSLGNERIVTEERDVNSLE